MKILILCTGNSCRSQMAEGFLKNFDSGLQVFSAGTKPGSRVSPYAVRVMAEVGIDISAAVPKNVEIFLNDEFDYVITVCDDAKETCPYFSGKVANRLHIPFTDPADATGTDEEIITVYRNVRDGIRDKFKELYQTLGNKN